MLGGAILTETIFAWPGIGHWLVEAIQRRDYPVLQGGTLLVATLVILVNLGVDLTLRLTEPADSPLMSTTLDPVAAETATIRPPPRPVREFRALLA